MAGVQKRKKYSKKRKANLRKYTNVKDVEEYIEDVARQEKTGGIVSEKTDAELFTIETSGADDVSTTCVRTQGSRKRIWKPLKCESNLLNESKIEPVVTKKPKLWKNKIKDKAKLLSKKATMSYTINNGSTSSNPTTTSLPSYDLWGTGDDGKEVEDDYYNEVTRKKRVKRPQTMDVHKNASSLPAVEVAHPGASYNPSFADHQALLHEAVGVEVEKHKKMKSLNETFSLPSMSNKEREATWYKEMTAGLYEEESSSDENIASDGEGVAVKVPVLADQRKTKKTKRKEAERKAEEAERKAKKKELIQQNEVYRLKSIVKVLQHKEADIATKRVSRQAKMEATKLQTRRLGTLQYADPDIDVQLSEELTGSLRTLKPEGNIARERLKSLQKRNRVEPRKIVLPHRRYKLKEKEKWSCK
ncbi:ribosome biogenesis protein NOP53-like isoform X2 [Dysidea avara]|uniref:ribosome biogenesis protein NOP53-like isoform X2 n=1 Tax=Dysidea avara TaxID=196820 RepID=UPI00331B0FA6